MRIVGGRWRGRVLESVGKGDKAAHLRPTPDRVRESLFNILAHSPDGDPVSGARALDVFAGTGAMGLEALSRGAAHVTFFEKGRTSLSLLGANLARLKAGDQARIIARDACRPGPCSGAPASLVMMDPPYGSPLGGKALLSLQDAGWIAENALVLWEDDAPQTAPDGFVLEQTRMFGRTHITFLRQNAGRS